MTSIPDTWDEAGRVIEEIRNDGSLESDTINRHVGARLVSQEATFPHSRQPVPKAWSYWVYDNNGNMLAGGSDTYDGRNRFVNTNYPYGDSYFYDSRNRRIFQSQGGTGINPGQLTLYGAYGERLATYGFNGPYAAGGVYCLTLVSFNIWFNGIDVIGHTTNPYTEASMWGDTQPEQDRLGTDRSSGARYLPHGEEITSTSNDRTKFGTYTRDSVTGLDYAQNRSYSSTFGRFNTPDPYAGSAKAGNPGSWNRYTYVLGDPVNRKDPSGMDPPSPADPSGPNDCSVAADCDLDGVPGGGYAGLNPCYQMGAGLAWQNSNPLGCFPLGGYPIYPSKPLAPLLSCDYEGAADGTGEFTSDLVTTGGPAGSAFVVPMTLEFNAFGGTGSYQFSVSQTFNNQGSLTYTNGTYTAPGVTKPDSLVPGELTQVGSFAVFTDSPGIRLNTPFGTIVSGNEFSTYVTKVTVSSGGQTVQCPAVAWDVQIDWPDGGTPAGENWVVSP